MKIKVILLTSIVIFLVIAYVSLEKTLGPLHIKTNTIELETSVALMVIAIFGLSFVIFTLLHFMRKLFLWPYYHLFQRNIMDLLPAMEEFEIAVLNGDYKKAKKSLSIIAKFNIPELLSQILLHELSVASMNQDNIKASLLLLTNHEKTARYAWDGLLNLAVTERKFDDALEYCDKLWEIAPDEKLMTQYIGIVLMQADWSKLLSLFDCRKFQKIAKRKTQADLNLIASFYGAVKLYNNSQHDDALEILENLYRDYDHSFLPLNILLIEILILKEKYYDIPKILKASWTIHPCQKLEQLFIECSQQYETASVLEYAFDITAEDTKSMLFIAKIALILEDFTLAAEYINRALQAEHVSARTYLLQAQLLLQTTRNMEAMRAAIDNAVNTVDTEEVIAYYWDMSENILTTTPSANAILITAV